MSQTAGYSLSALGPIGAGALHQWTGSWTPVIALLVTGTALQGLAALKAGAAQTIESPPAKKYAPAKACPAGTSNAASNVT